MEYLWQDDDFDVDDDDDDDEQGPPDTIINRIRFREVAFSRIDSIQKEKKEIY